MTEVEWRAYRLWLPHFRMAGATYFVTWRLYHSQPELEPAERDVIIASLRHFERQRYFLPAHVVMNDHVHVLVIPHEQWRLEQVVHGWKSFTAHELTKRFGRVAPVWQPESYDRIVRDQAEFEEKTAYILNNPNKRWPGVVDYRWVGYSTDE